MFTFPSPSRIISALLLALSFTDVAHADAQSGVRIRNIELATIDLTPDDGQSAGFTINWEENRRLSVATDIDNIRDERAIRIAPGTPGSLEYELDGGYAYSATNGDLGDITLATNAGPALGIGNGVLAGAIHHVELTLRPGTLLMVSGAVAIELTRSLQEELLYESNAFVMMEINDGGNFVSAMSLQEWLVGPTATEVSRSLEFLLPFANSYDRDRIVNLYIWGDTTTFLTSVSPPVPEPSTFSMMLTGILANAMLLRVRSWRKSRQGAAARPAT